MPHRLILKVTKFQLPPPKRLGTVVKNILGGASCPPPCQIGLKLVYITKVLLMKLNKIESDFKVVHHLSTNHAFSEIDADPLKLSKDYTQNHMKKFKGMILILYSGTSLAYFGTSFVFCLYYVFGDLKYALSNTTLSILFFISVICQSQNSDSFPYFQVLLLYSIPVRKTNIA